MASQVASVSTPGGTEVHCKEESTPGGTEVHTEVAPWMPHCNLTQQQLDEQFPSIVAPGDDGLEDVARDEDDPMLQHGQKLAKEIVEDMVRNGRTRRDPLASTFSTLACAYSYYSVTPTS